jgi:hypothetical protein
MLTELRGARRKVTVGDWPDRQLPASAAETQRIRMKLIVLALVGLVALVVSLLARQ